MTAEITQKLEVFFGCDVTEALPAIIKCVEITDRMLTSSKLGHATREVGDR